MSAAVSASLAGCASSAFSQSRPVPEQINGVLSFMDSGMASDHASAARHNKVIEFDAILSGMEPANVKAAAGTPDLGAILGAMEPDIDFDGILTSMGDERQLISSVTESITITKTLDFISDTYSKPAGFLTASWNPRSDDRLQVYTEGKVLPVHGRITSRFGYRPKYHRQHKGIDIALHIGDTVCAAMAGTVTRIDFERKGYGLYVVMQHANGIETRYAHLSYTLVWPGMSLKAGQPLALGGNSGNSTGPHLHFETRINNVAVDPAIMFDFSAPSGVPAQWQFPSQYYYAADPVIYPFAGSDSPVSNTDRDRNTYVVRTGDTISKIAKATGIPVMKLCNLNMLAPSDPLSPGRMIRLR